MKRPSTIRREFERYADKRQAGVSAAVTQDIRTSEALLRQARAVLFFIKEGVSDTAPNLAERELIRLICDVAILTQKKVAKHG